MAEKSNEDVVFDLCALCQSDSTLDQRNKARAAVLARMAGPGEVVAPEETLRRIRRTCEMSASIMRDGTRTGFWSGAENVARAFDRIRLLAARPQGDTDG